MRKDAMHPTLGLTEHRDGDGVPNRDDRRPDTPYRC